MVSGKIRVEGMGCMDIFGCDHECRTVGGSIIKYNVPDDRCAEFDAHDGAYPIVCIRVDQIRKIPAMMDLKLRSVEDPDDEYAGCIVLTEKRPSLSKSTA